MMNPFDQKAKDWDAPEKVAMTKELAQKVRSHLKNPNPHKVLDFGCGTGLFGLEFLDETNTVDGLDSSEGMLEVFHSKLPANRGKAILICEGEKLAPILDRDYDLIVSSMAFHHLEKPRETLAELFQALAPGGEIVIVDLDQEDGTFHPDNKAMGVRHFGFSKETLEQWGKELGAQTEHTMIKTIDKNDRSYGQFMVSYSR